MNGESQETLRHALGLGQSGAVRLVNRLAREGLATRSSGQDERKYAVTLTEAGTAAARAAIQARATLVAMLLEPLDEDEHEQLTNALEKVLKA